MAFSIGLDIGGTKIAGAAFSTAGEELAQIMLPTPDVYDVFLDSCRAIVEKLEQKYGCADSIGACAPYVDDNVCANVPCLIGKNVRHDLEKLLVRQIPFGNDANCAALAEAMEGMGKGYRAVFGLIMGTGIGGGFVLDGHIMTGANGLCGEIGHLPLPHYEESDGEAISCACGQKICIEKLISGAALARLYQSLVGQAADARQIGDRARQGDRSALHVLDCYYTVVAKAMTTILHTFDPDIIIVSGGLNTLPDLYVEIPKRWGQYAICKNPKTKFVPASFGATAGLRGAAWLGKNS